MSEEIKLLLGKFKLFVLTKKATLYNQVLKNDKVQCPICNNSFASFLPFGDRRPRVGAICPICHSKERTRLCWLYLMNRYGRPEIKKKVLHIAPEHAIFGILRNLKNVEYYPVDKFDDYLEGMMLMDITDIRFENDFFDVVLCSHVLEHIPDDLKAMSEMYRVLRPDGIAILQVPLGKNMLHTYEDFTITTPSGRAEAFWSEEHVRIYGADFEDRLKSVGFRILENNYVDSFSAEEQSKYGLPNDKTYYKEGFVVVTK